MPFLIIAFNMSVGIKKNFAMCCRGPGVAMVEVVKERRMCLIEEFVKLNDILTEGRKKK